MTTHYRPIKGTNFVIPNDQYQEIAQQWRAGKASSGWSFDLKVRTKAGADLSESDAGPDSDLAASGQYGGAVQPDYADGGLIAPAGRPLVLANVLRKEETSSNLVRIVQDVQADSDANADVPEGSAYTVADEYPVPYDYPVVDTAVILPVSEDFTKDVPTALSYLTKRLGYLVQRAEESQLVNGNGTPPSMLGLLNASNASETASATTLAAGSIGINTAIAELIAMTYNNSGCAPEWIAMNADNWFSYATQLATADGDYQAGHANQPGPRTLWNLPVVLSNAIPDANVIVGSSAAVGRWVHTSGLRVELSTGYGSYFGQGLIAVRGKIRSTLAYEFPSGIGILTGLPATTLTYPSTLLS